MADTGTSLQEGELLRVLQAHGERFLGSFSLPEQISGSRKRKRKSEIGHKQSCRPTASNDDLEEEWGGIAEHFVIHEGGNLDGQPGIIKPDLEHDDDDFRADSNSASRASVVVFDNSSSNPQPSNLTSKPLKKAFMSSKISKLREEMPGSSKLEDTEVDADERSNAQNDALLHHLVHTELLSGSSNPELNLSAAKRRKALAGRILELSGDARLGKGHKAVIEKERNKATKRVRDGLIEMQRARATQELEEAKNSGNYHPTIKKLFKSSADSANRKRDRGLKMGVGRFSGGLLKLSGREVTLVQGGPIGQSSNRGWHNRGRRDTK